MAKVDQTKANALLRAARTMSLGANKNTIRILYGFEPGAKTKLKKGIRGWSKRTDNRRAFSAVIDVAVNYFGFDPINPEASFRQIDFNRIMSVLHNLGYFVCAPEVNKIIEILTSMKEIEELGACEKCKRPYIVPVTNDAHCPRCRLSSTASAIERYSQEELD
ncbi:Uncharacterised protein [Enterobacter kobei]|uniref:hypothetical protein n=1 Tax=Enterobacter kobei TaxID=208224 RepID=UPI0007C9FD6D|nr:hypothetical protein [Enterobacter kobei]SAM58757.1 Uncharacterised protein [Enterobacter kobei]